MVHLYREVVTSINEFDQQRKIISKTLIITFSYQRSFIFFYQPVSYTHLDVYKRQVYSPFMAEFVYYGQRGMNRLNMDYYIPVSYTHLTIENHFLLFSLYPYSFILDLKKDCIPIIFHTNPNAVSYTHLDVYKRQHQMNLN